MLHFLSVWEIKIFLKQKNMSLKLLNTYARPPPAPPKLQIPSTAHDTLHFFHESMALMVTKNLPKLLVLKSFYKDGHSPRKIK